MNFKEFKKSARLLCSLLPHNAKEIELITGIKIHGDELQYLLVYDKNCYINLELQSHPIADFFSYYLVIGNEEYCSDDLEELEKILFKRHYLTS